MDRSRENSPDNSMATAAHNVGEAAASAADRVSESLEQGRAALADMQAAVAEKTKECMELTDAYVHDNPWQAIGIAAGVGLIIGLLIRGR